jgi:HEAT repeat protein
VTHLRRHLEQTGTLAAEQLDAALRRQQIYGGSLDTVLLELEILDPHSLNELLQQACGLDIVPVDLIDNGVDRPDGVVPEELVQIGWAVPLAEIDGKLHVAVHPDLPNERLGALYRAVPGVVPMVTPECALEKMAAELTRSVVPQRYAVLCASYLSTLRRRPSVSDAGIPLIDEVVPSGDTQRTSIPQDPSAPAARESAMDTRRTQFYRRVDIDNAIASTRLGVPDGVKTGETQITRLSAPPPPDSPVPEPEPEAEETPEPSPEVTPPPVTPPPIRFTVGNRKPPVVKSETHDAEAPPPIEGAPSSALESTLTALSTANGRDAVIEALVRGAMTVSARVALFRIKGDALQGMSTPRSAVEDLAGKTIPVRKGSDLRHAVEATRWTGTTADSALREAVGVGAIVPCMTLRIDVAGRPTLLMYLDHAGREFQDIEAKQLDALVTAASEAFERLIKARRTTGPSPSAAPVPPPPEAAIPKIVAHKGDASAELEPPPTFGTTEPARWGPAPAELDGSRRSAGRVLDDEHRPRRVTQLDGSGTAQTTPSATEERVTVRVTPPVDVDTDADASRVVETRSISPGGPLFAPPGLDERENSGIISLSSPIGQASARGKIELDEEDKTPAAEPESDESRLDAIDKAIDAVARRGAELQELSRYEEEGLARLAALFPGPLEVLRRDLRALPPPSAHGPYIRLAIRLGQKIVPFILELFPHPDPDVRFYAAFLFQELRDERCMSGLAKLAFDGSGDVRVVAMRVLETYARMAGFETAVASVRAELDGDNRTRQLYAARAVGTLRDVAAIPDLIELLASSDRFIQEAALESLCSVTGQQHGLKPHRWRSWYDEHGSEHRIEWVIQSLRHRDLPVRRWAHDELIRVTGHRVPFSPLGDKKSREVAVDSWTDWWLNTGRERFGAAANAKGYGV